MEYSTQIHNAAHEYFALGWKLVPLHDVTAGHCSCRAGSQCRSAGKHPRGDAGWQHRLISNVSELGAALLTWPGLNLGIATGPASGVWALDVDPKNGGDEALQRLPPVGPTRTHSTGSGGRHHLYQLPAEFPIGGSSRLLPAGLDVRGINGLIVAPPSRTLLGGYGVVDPRVPLATPTWLRDMLRPAVAPERAPVAPLEVGDGSRGQAYAAAAVRGACEELERLHAGRNSAAYAAACRLIELGNAGWSGLDGDAVRGRWAEAVHAHPDGIAVPASEVAAIWASASRHVGAAAAEPPPGGDGIWLGGAMLPFAAPAAEPMAEPAAEPVEVVDDELVDPAAAMLAELLDVDALQAIPRPDPLVAGLLDRNTCAWLLGRSGSLKTFVALDIAAHVATGRPWHGRAVTQGTVVYVCAEDVVGFGARVAAWGREFCRPSGLLTMPRPVQTGNAAEWALLTEVCVRVGAVLVVLDTQARVTVGRDENSNTEMGLFVDAVDQMRRATGACVLTIHHQGRSGVAARGASALDGAMDTGLRMDRTGPLTATLHTDKQKSRAEADPIGLELRASNTGVDPLTLEPIGSLVVCPGDVPPAPAIPPVVTDEELVGKVGEAALVCREHVSKGRGATKAEIWGLLRERGFGDVRSTWVKTWGELVERKILASVRGTACWKYVPLDKRAELTEPINPLDETGQSGFYA